MELQCSKIIRFGYFCYDLVGFLLAGGEGGGILRNELEYPQIWQETLFTFFFFFFFKKHCLRSQNTIRLLTGWKPNVATSNYSCITASHPSTKVFELTIKLTSRTWTANLSNTDHTVYKTFELETTQALSDIYGNLSNFVRVELVSVATADAGSSTLAIFRVVLNNPGSVAPEELKQVFEVARHGVFSGASIREVKRVETATSAGDTKKWSETNYTFVVESIYFTVTAQNILKVVFEQP